MLLPFCYMSFYVANRKFYHEEVASKLYHPSAYYLATNLAGDDHCTYLISNMIHDMTSAVQQRLGLVGLGSSMCCLQERMPGLVGYCM